MKVPHSFVGNVRPSAVPMGYLQPAQVDVSGLARGVMDLGAGIAAMETRARERDEKTQRFDSLRGFSDFETRMAQQLAEMKRDADPTGKGFAAQADAFYRQEEAKFLQSLPADLQAEFRYRGSEMRGRILSESLDFQYKAGDAHYRKGIDAEYQKALTGLDPTVGGDPRNLESWRTKVFEQIDTSDLPEFTGSEETPGKAELKRMISIGLEGTAYKQRYKARSAAMQLPAAQSERAARAMSFYVNKGYTQAQAAGIVGNLLQESGLDTAAVGDSNTSFGIAQWRGERLTRLKRFAAANGRDWQDFDTQLEFVDMELKNHETGAYERLRRAGTVDEATAAMIGYERPRGWSEGNPRGGHGWSNRLAFASKLAGVPIDDSLDTDPAFANVPYEDRVSLRQDADAEINRELAAAAEQRRLSVATQQNDLLNGIMDGTRGKMDIDAAYQEGWGADYDFRKKATDLWEKKNEEAEMFARFNSAIAGDMVWDPISDDGKKLYNNWATQVGATQQLAANNQDFVNNTLLPVYAKLSDAAPAVISHLQGQVRSNNQQQALFAYDTLSQMQDLDEEAFDMRVPEDLAKRVDLYRAMRGVIAPDELMGMLNGGYTQEQRQRQRLLEEEAQKNLAKADRGIPAISEKVASILDEVGGWGSTELVAVPAFARELNADFQNSYTAAFIMTGDDEKATELATTWLQRYWGFTNVGGQEIFMKYPPEKVGYKPLAGRFDYMGTQIRQELGLAETDTFQLIGDEQTEREFKQWQAGADQSQPSYMIVTKDAQGIYRLRMGDDGKPYRYFYEPTAVDEATRAAIKTEEERFFDERQALDRLTDLNVQIERGQEFMKMGGGEVPQELIEERDALQRQVDELQKANPVKPRARDYTRRVGPNAQP